MRLAYPDALMHSIPNGGVRFKATAGRLKSEGLTPGVPDLFLAEPRGTCHGLYIEMKAPKGRLSENQRGIIPMLETRGYRVAVCHGFESAQEAIREYLGPPKIGRAWGGK
jgi:hypothetical protein